MQCYAQEVNASSLNSDCVSKGIVNLASDPKVKKFVILAHGKNVKGYGHKINATFHSKCVNIAGKAVMLHDKETGQLDRMLLLLKTKH